MKTTAARTLHLSGMDVFVYADSAAASLAAAEHIARTIEHVRLSRGTCVLGLATGSTPTQVYAHLVERYRGGALSFQGVSTYNLDEYYPIAANDTLSYHAYMYEHLFRHIDLLPARAHVLDGTIPEPFVAEHCAQFERFIEAEGGLDLQLLGIGRNGHIGFNEPIDLPVERARGLRTRMVELHPTTRADAAREFGSVERVIPRALTMGVGTILDARSIVMLATGAAKAEAVARALAGPPTMQTPASLLALAPQKTTWYLDEAAAREVV